MFVYFDSVFVLDSVVCVCIFVVEVGKMEWVEFVGGVFVFE